MADIPSVTYITEDEVKAQTLLTGLKTLHDQKLADLTLLIQTAEDQIDKYVGRQPHHQFDGNLQRVFPRAQDYAVIFSGVDYIDYPHIPQIPYDVSRACLRQVEWLFAQWYGIATTDLLPSEHPMEQEVVGGDGSYGGKLAYGGTAYKDASLCEAAKVYLDGFAPRTAPLGTTDPRTAPFPRRDSPIRFNVLP